MYMWVGKMIWCDGLGVLWDVVGVGGKGGCRWPNLQISSCDFVLKVHVPVHLNISVQKLICLGRWTFHDFLCSISCHFTPYLVDILSNFLAPINIFGLQASATQPGLARGRHSPALHICQTRWKTTFGIKVLEKQPSI